MHLLCHLSSLLFLGCAQSAPEASSAALPAPVLRPADERLHVIAERFSDVDGRIHQLGLRGEVAPLALVFLDPRSPAASASLEALQVLAAKAQELGAEFFGVVSSPAVSVQQARAWRDEHGLGFPLLFDASGELASRLQPSWMPECFVLTKADSLAYRGRILPTPGAPNGGLRQALAAVCRGEQPATPGAPAGGEAFEPWPLDLGELELSYNRNVAPILEANCVDCHREGDVAPFALDSYAKVKRRARMILYVGEEGIMPPWHANPEVNLFREQRFLSDRQLEIIRTWSDAKSPEGEPGELLPRREHDQGGWRLGTPDLVLRLPAFALPAEGADVFQNFVVPSGLTESRMVVGIEFRPKAKSVMHHMALHVDDSGTARAMDEADSSLGFSSFGPGVDAGQEGAELRGFDFPMVRGWAPGQEPFEAPKGLGIPIPAGSDFLVATHYHLDGTAVIDESEIGLYFGEPLNTRPMFLATMLTNEILIPAGESNYVRHVQSVLPAEVVLLNVTPHMHNLGASVSLWATLPGEPRRQLLEIPRWDYRWQNTYTFLEPLHLPKGTLLEAIHRFDNSADNPDNPSSPPREVGEGWYTFDEMCILYFNLLLLHPAAERSDFFLSIPTTLKGD